MAEIRASFHTKPIMFLVNRYRRIITN